MAIAGNLSLEDLDAIQIAREYPLDGLVGVRLGLVCTLYVRNPHQPEVRANLAECGDQYLREFGQHLKVYQKPTGSSRILPYPAKGLSLLDYVTTKDSPDKDFAPVFHGEADYHAASTYGLDIFASSNTPSPIRDKPAYITAVFPFSWLKGKEGEHALQEWVAQWCRMLKPFHGYAGIGAIQSVDLMDKKRTSYLVYPLARRFPGLEVDNPGVISNHMGNYISGLKIKGVNWLTALDDQCLNELGGRDQVLAQLDETFRWVDYGSGLLIQAGATPQLGDINTGHMPHSYKLLANVIKPLRLHFPEGHSLLQTRDDRSNTEVTNEWLARFDEQ